MRGLDAVAMDDAAETVLDAETIARIIRRMASEMLERIGPVWGIGEDGELNNMFKRTPQQGLWFIAGGLAQCRINSKYLALQIKAMELGLLGPLG